jgi:protein-L-isoaspartate(D-aspartate) O-methyltransferase
MNFTLEDKMRLIFSIRQKGVTDARIISAIERIPREKFVDPEFLSRAYDDTALPIANGQTISQPSVVGLMTNALRPTQRCKVLEVGAGSGYQAAILSQLCRRVYTVERHSVLVRQAQERFDALGLTNVTAVLGDGTRGWPAQQPFDRIIITAAADDPPKPLLEQLRVGGIMVLPVGQSDSVQQIVVVEKVTEDTFNYNSLSSVRFVPLVEGVAEDEEVGGV